MKYKAFISYNSKDNCTARWLQSKLENYSLPSLIVNEKGDVLRSYDRKPKKFRIFRYVTDLVAQNLDDGLRQELDQSEYLVVICSPNSANAPWVKEEVKYFIETGRKKKIIPFVIEGKPYSGDEEECFTQELKDAFPNGSALGVSLKDHGDDLWIFRRRKAVAKIVSLLIDLPNAFDFIWNRYRRSYISRLFLYILSVVIFIGSLFTVYSMNKEFEAKLFVTENTINNYLPPVAGTIKIKIGNESRAYSVNGTTDAVVIPDIARKYFKQEVRIKFDSQAYLPIDTTMLLNKELYIPIRRNEAFYGDVQFTVVDLENGETVPYCKIMIEEKEYISDERGVIKAHINLVEQRDKYNISSTSVILQTSTISAPTGMHKIVEIIHK